VALLQLACAEAAAGWLRARVRGMLVTDSRRMQPGDGFIGWPGHAVDGRRFVPAALQAGAAACLVEAAGAEAWGFDDERVATLHGLKAAAGAVADAYFEHPSQALQMVATTGTNGKTSTAWWTAQALTRLGRRCGLVGTLGIGEPPPAAPAAGDHAAGLSHGTLESSGLTTPDPVTLHAALRRFADAGFGACALEASSIGLAEERLAGAKIDVALFTNFTRDHLDFHGTMDAYWQAKRRLFAWPGLGAAVVNVDDAHGEALAAELQRGTLDLWTVSVEGRSRLTARAVQHRADGLAFSLHEGDRSVPVASTLVGGFNVANLLVAVAALRALGVPLADAARTVPALTPVPGRLQRLGAAGGPEVVVDYAHTPDALRQVLRALRPLAAARGGRLWCVFGCGGSRDASKRPLMGAIAAQCADQVVLTSDNPRDEVPRTILAQILAGVVGHEGIDVIEDRREAIGYAVQAAAPADVVLLAGKGHEETQEVAGVKRPFSDLAEARAALDARSVAGGCA
jgi:MurE/MurF fusion protein